MGFDDISACVGARSTVKAGVASRGADLVVSCYTPTVDRGRALRTYGVIAALARDRDVDVLFKPFGANEPPKEYMLLPHVRLSAITVSSGPRRAAFCMQGMLRGVVPADARALTPELGRAALEAARVPGRGRVIADGTAAATQLAIAGLDFVYLAHNVESSFRRMLPYFRRSYVSVSALERYERNLLLSARESWMASARDIELAEALAPQAKLRYVPNVIDIRSIEPVKQRVRAPRALLVGDYSYPPNAQALEFAATEVMPRVWSRLPKAELLVAGHHLVLPPDADSRIRPLGFVPDLHDAYAMAACVVVPLLHGGGSPLKFVEALAYGVPVVATGVAAAGLEVEAGVHYRRADSAQEFAEVMTEVLRSGASELAANGRRLAELRYSVDALADLLAV